MMTVVPLFGCLGLLVLIGLVGAVLLYSTRQSARQPGFNQSAFIWAGLATAVTTLFASPVVGFILLMMVAYSIPGDVPFREFIGFAILGIIALSLVAAAYRVFYKMFIRLQANVKEPEQ